MKTLNYNDVLAAVIEEICAVFPGLMMHMGSDALRLAESIAARITPSEKSETGEVKC